VFFGVVIATLACAVRSGELETARAALQDGLYPIAQAHAQKALREKGADPVQALQVLLEAQAGQGLFAEMLNALETHDAVVRRASQPEAFVYWQALALLHSGRAAEAVRLTGSITLTDSAHADALRRLGARSRLAVGDAAGALILFSEVDRTSTNAMTRAANALEWAMALKQAGRDDAALAVLKMQSELGVQSVEMSEGTLMRARILMRLGKAAEAKMAFTQLAMSERAGETSRVQALVEMSVFAFDNGKTNEAIAYARSAYERAQLPETRRLAGFRLGDLLSSDVQTIDEGEKLVKTLVREFPEDALSMQAQLKMADSLLQAKRPERAASEYRIFLETYPSSSLDVLVLQGRGWALLQLGMYTEASGVFQRAAELATNVSVKAECLFKQGDALLADARYGEAALAYSRLATETPQSPLADRALYQSAECLERAGRREEACAGYRKVADSYPNHDVAPKAMLRLASLQTEASAFDEAIRTFTALLAKFSQKAVRGDALMGRGKVYYRTFRFDAAMQDFASVAESDLGRRDEARFLLTLCLYGLGRDMEARTAGASFLVDFPESPRLPDMILWLGKFDFNRSKFSEARRFFLDFVARWPGNSWADAALVWAARAAFGEADFTGTVEGVARLVREYPQSLRLIEARIVQVDALMELARFDEAVLVLEHVIEQSQDSEWVGQARLRKGDCLFALGADNSVRYQEAMHAYRDLLQQSSLTPTLVLQLHYKVGRCLEKMKRVDEAIDHYYSEVMIRYQNERSRGVWYDDTGTSLYVRAAFNIAELYEQKGLPEQAVSVLQRLIQSGVPGGDEARQRIERLRKKRS
jgi:tetratricopeptide (TPR) repeat protein